VKQAYYSRLHLISDFCFQDIRKDKNMGQQVAKKVRYLRILVRWNHRKKTVENLFKKTGQLLKKTEHKCEEMQVRYMLKQLGV
jgi:predicted DNA-binding protein YlxM (UPF0122 family)